MSDLYIPAVENRTDRENIIALFYEVRQARLDFQNHIDEDREHFKKVGDTLEEINANLTKAGAIAGALKAAVAMVFGSGGLYVLLKHFLGWNS